MTDGGMSASLLSGDQGRFWRSFMGASTLLNQRLSQELLQTYGLTLGEFGVLWQLAEAPNHRMRMAALAESLCFTRSRTTQIMDRLERAEHARRDKSPADGRGVVATITSSGLELVERAGPIHAEATEALFLSHFETEDVGELSSRLERVIEGLRGRANGHH